MCCETPSARMMIAAAVMPYALVFDAARFGFEAKPNSVPKSGNSRPTYFRSSARMRAMAAGIPALSGG